MFVIIHCLGRQALNRFLGHFSDMATIRSSGLPQGSTHGSPRPFLVPSTNDARNSNGIDLKQLFVDGDASDAWPRMLIPINEFTRESNLAVGAAAAETA